MPRVLASVRHDKTKTAERETTKYQCSRRVRAVASAQSDMGDDMRGCEDRLSVEIRMILTCVDTSKGSISGNMLDVSKEHPVRVKPYVKPDMWR